MLSYAFRVLKQDDYREIGTESFENIQNLFAAILSKGIAIQIKQGLYREYVELEDELSTLRGKLNIIPSIRLKVQHKQKLNCTHDEYSENNIFNQILKATIYHLIRHSDVKNEYKLLLKSQLLFFKNIEDCNINSINWQRLRFQKNNESYKMLINICYFVLVGLLQTDGQGKYKMATFLLEKEMHRLYERFILEYYRYHYIDIMSANAKQVAWATEEDSVIDFLPKMQTDIMLERENKKLIIDAKYYAKNTTSTQYEKETLRSAHLYQIFAYVQNEDRHNTGNVSGVLLYAKTIEDTLFEPKTYKIKGNTIAIRTLDLSLPFGQGGEVGESIRNQLDSIAKEFFKVEPTRK